VPKLLVTYGIKLLQVRISRFGVDSVAGIKSKGGLGVFGMIVL
jgi:hypothetical protein